MTTRTAASVVGVRGGQVRGLVDEGIHAFLGIPYAAAPVGEHRFAAPAPVESWDGVKEATAYGASAPQPAQGFTIIPEPAIAGDNCLNLNVFTPDPGTAGLPVLVYIHGGGFTNGCNGSPWYHGGRFARDGVVLVAVNYRLGALGFAAVEGAPLNRGVLDWLAALEWVHDNIGGFGGDAGNVTIAGQSAGAVATTTLMTLPRARGLFHRVIAMSGGPQGAGRRDDVVASGQAVADALGVPATLDGLAGVSDERIIEAQSAGGTPGTGRMRFVPVADGDLIPEHPMKALATGAGRDVPVMIGATAEEVTHTRRMTGQDADRAKVERLLARFGLDADAVEAYLAARPGQPAVELFGQAVTDNTFRVPAVRFAEARATTGAAAPTFLYDFRWQSSAWDGVGAVHCADIPFVFDNLHVAGAERALGPERPQHLAGTIHGAWLRFLAGEEPWPGYDVYRRATMVFDIESVVVDDALAFERALWPSRAGS